MTNLNDVWKEFRIICGYDSSEIPQNDEEIYGYCESAVKKYNQLAKKYVNRIQGDLKIDVNAEILNKNLSETEVMILANLIAERFTYNKYVEFTSVWSVFAKETGIQNYQSQCKAREYTIQSYKNEVERLILDQIDSFEIGD